MHKTAPLGTPSLIGEFQQFDTVLGVLPIAVAAVDRDMHYLMMNHQWAANFHLNDSNVIGKNHLDLIPNIPEVWKDLYNRALDGETFANDEDRFIHVDGTTQFISWRILPWYSAAQSKPAGLILTIQDITRGVAKQLNREVKLGETVDVIRQRVETILTLNEALAEAETESDILAALNSLSVANHVDLAAMYYADVNEENVLAGFQPVAAHNFKATTQANTSTLQRLDMNDNPALANALGVSQSTSEYILIENFHTDKRFDTDQQFKQLIQSNSLAAVAVLPLRTAVHWHGFVLFAWTKPQTFDTEVRELFNAVRPSIASAVAARQSDIARNQAYDRTSALNMINAVLLRAIKEQEILVAFSLYTNPDLLTLDYIENDVDEAPLAFTRVASWKDSQPWLDDPELNVSKPLAENLTTELWMHALESVIFVEDVQNDARFSEIARAAVTAMGSASMIFIPLQGSGVWQGLLTLVWSTPRSFSSTERAIYEDAAQIVASVVASRRAYLAQEEARKSTESLLKISTDLSQAISEDDVLEALGAFAFDTGASIIDMYYTEGPDDGDPTMLRMVASWKDCNAWPENPGFNQAIQISDVLPAVVVPTDEVRFIENLSATNNTDLRTLVQNATVSSLVFIPLHSSSRWHGIITIQWAVPHEFTDTERYIYTASAATAASVVASRRLYIQTLENVVRLREMDTVKNEFMSSMSHELRTPLNAIIGLSDIILNGLDGEINPKVEGDLRTVFNAGQQLLNIVNDILDIAKIEAGHLNLILSDLKIDDPVVEAVETAMVMAESKNLALVKNIPDGLPMIKGDRARLRQIVLNLLSNAIKFTEEGTVEIAARLEKETVIIWVKDNGIGIDPQHHALIFEQFRQVEGALTRKKGGTGLGLPISKRLVELHGGKMWLESALGKGATFYISLPVETSVTS